MVSIFSLPVEKRIMIHLSEYSRHADAWEAPYEVSQEGMAERLGILLNNVSRAMGPLRDDGFVLEKLKHVKGMKRRRKTYFLTPRGSRLASDAKEALLDTRITYVDFESKARTENLHSLVDYLERNVKPRPTFLEVVAFFQLSDPFDCTAFKGHLEKRKRRKRFVSYTEKAPIIPNFIGRDDELRTLQGFLEEKASSIIVIQGIAGMGKTALGVKLLEDFKARRHTFWHKIRGFDTVKSVVGELSEFLALVGRKQLGTYLSSGKPFELGKLSDLMESELKDVRAMLVFDDFQNASADLTNLFSILADIMTRSQNIKLIILTRLAPNFYEVRDAGVMKFVKELRLEGLRPSSTRTFLEPMELSDNELESIHDLTKGMPLFLELIRNMGLEGAAPDLRRFIEGTILSKLAEGERDALNAMSVFRYPVPLELLLSGDFKYSSLSSLVKRSLVVEYPGDLFEVHDAIKEHAYRLMNQSERRAHHEKAAEVLLSALKDDSLREDERDTCGFEAVHHLQKAEDWGRAFRASVDLLPGLVSKVPREVSELLKDFRTDELEEEQLAKLLALRGDAYALDEKWKNALEDYRKASKLMESHGLKEDLAHVHSNMAQVQMNVKRWSETLGSHRKALKLFDEVEDERGRARELMALGMSYKNMKRYDKAKEVYEKSLKLLKRLNDISGQGAVLNNLALLYESMGNWSKARRSIDRSLELLKDNELERAKVLLNLGGLLEGRGLSKDAVEAYEESLELYDKNGSASVVDAHLRLGEVHLSEGNHDKALKHFENARKAHESTSRLRLRRKREHFDLIGTRIHDRLIEAYREVKDWPRCVELLTEDIQRMEVAKDRSRLALRCLELGLAYENLGMHEDAVDSLRKAQTILVTTKDARGLIAVNLNLGRVLAEMGDLQASKKCYESALKDAKKMKDKEGVEAAISGLKKL